MAAMDTKSHITWLAARSGVRRVTKVMPMPDSRNTSGRMAGSAPGARNRTAMWAATKATMSAMGTNRVERVTVPPSVTTYMA